MSLTIPKMLLEASKAQGLAKLREDALLLRLVLRMAKHRGEEPNIETFRQCAMYRAIKMANLAPASKPELEPALA